MLPCTFFVQSKWCLKSFKGILVITFWQISTSPPWALLRNWENSKWPPTAFCIGAFEAFLSTVEACNASNPTNFGLRKPNLGLFCAISYQISKWPPPEKWANFAPRLVSCSRHEISRLQVFFQIQRHVIHRILLIFGMRKSNPGLFLHYHIKFQNGRQSKI